MLLKIQNVKSAQLILNQSRIMFCSILPFPQQLNDRLVKYGREKVPRSSISSTKSEFQDGRLFQREIRSETNCSNRFFWRNYIFLVIDVYGNAGRPIAREAGNKRGTVPQYVYAFHALFYNVIVCDDNDKVLNLLVPKLTSSISQILSFFCHLVCSDILPVIHLGWLWWIKS